MFSYNVACAGASTLQRAQTISATNKSTMGAVIARVKTGQRQTPLCAGTCGFVFSIVQPWLCALYWLVTSLWRIGM